MERFGEKLGMLRKSRGLSFRRLGAELEVVHSHLVAIENGSKQPSIDLLMRIAVYFGVSLDDLMFDDRNLRLK